MTGAAQRQAPGGQGLGGWAVFAAVLAAAGLPVYLHAPKVYAEAHGVGLAELGAALVGLRLLDLVQDPLLGRLSDRLGARRGHAAALAALVMAAGMLGLFAVPPPVAPLAWFALTLTLVFSAYSFLTIAFYARGVARAGGLGPLGHLRLARWRETGSLTGVCLAALAPPALAALGLGGYAGFAVLFAAATLLAAALMRRHWAGPAAAARAGFAPVLRDRRARHLLMVALANAAPLAVTSTLFLFFVESRLAAPAAAGPLLLVFFVSAAAAAPAWGRAAERVGARAALMAAMLLAILAFAVTLMLGPGDVLPFALVCAATGAALGADLTLLPALFARRLETVAPEGGAGFALWSFVQKFTLALAAGALLPGLEAAGFRPGAEVSDPGALRVLALFYAAVPCALKVAAVALLATYPAGED
ncbi:MFS transporter [Roseivivax sp. CAU 1761]